MLTNQSIGYMDAPVPKDLDLKEAIDKLRKEKNAIILAHYYQTGDIQDIADYVGDSLALAQWAAKTKADIIVLCGVHFMGETAKILWKVRREALKTTTSSGLRCITTASRTQSMIPMLSLFLTALHQRLKLLKLRKQAILRSK